MRRFDERFVGCHVDDGVDYRTLGNGTRFATARLLAAGTGPAALDQEELVSAGHWLPVGRAADGTLWADLRALLAPPRPGGRTTCCSPGPARQSGCRPSRTWFGPTPTRGSASPSSDVAHDIDTPLLLELTCAAGGSGTPGADT